MSVKYELGISVTTVAHYVIQVEAKNADAAVQKVTSFEFLENIEKVEEENDCQGVDTKVSIEWIGTREAAV